MRGKRYFFSGLLLLLLGLWGLMASMHRSHYSQGVRGFYQKAEYASNGERIYYLGLNRSGERIPFEGGPHWMWMMGGSCVNCHGVEGRGGYPVMMSTEISPDITYRTLTSGEHGGHGDEDEEHTAVPYDDAMIRRAIREGIDSGGRVMNWTMPRWDIGEEDLDDLVDHLKLLDLKDID